MKTAIVILAAGKGTRMKSDKAKVLHELAGRPMISYVVDTACRVVGENVVLVVGHQAPAVTATVCAEHAGLRFALQSEQLGTGHAVGCALAHLPKSTDTVVVLCGDVPLLTAGTIQALMHDHALAGRDISVLAVTVENPTGYGRILMDDARNLRAIVEEADATPPEKKIKTINSGIYCVNRAYLHTALHQIQPDNAQAEYYLTDIVAVGYREGRNVGVLVSANADEIVGVNTLKDLQHAEKLIKNRTSETP